jgi:hypothetical protein
MIRKLPPDPMLSALIRFGFRYSDIARRFKVTCPAVSKAAHRLGFPPCDHRIIHRNVRQPLRSNRALLAQLRAA